MIQELIKHIFLTAIFLIFMVVGNSYANNSLLPIVSIISPVSKSSFTAESNIKILIKVSSNNSRIIKVEFYNNAQLIGKSLLSPFSFNWNKVPKGKYNLMAKAYDVRGMVGASKPIIISVNPAQHGGIISQDQIFYTVTGTVGSGSGNIMWQSGATINPTSVLSGTVVIFRATPSSGSPLIGSVFSSWSGVACTDITGQSGATCTVVINSNTNAIANFIPTYSVFYAVTNSGNAGGTMGCTGSPNCSSCSGNCILSASLGTALTFTATPATGSSFGSWGQACTNIGSSRSPYTCQVSVNGITSVSASFNPAPMGPQISFAYDAFGNQISLTDQRGNVLTKIYDAYDRLFKVQDPSGGITQFNDDTEGHLQSLIDANAHQTTYTYDPNGRLLTQTNPLGFTTTYAYDKVGNQASKTDANGKVTTYTYDALNRLVNILYSDGTQVTNTYDALGRKISMADSRGQTIYTYDPLNRLLSKSDPGTNTIIKYTYDSQGNRLTIIDQNNRTIANTYDNLNRLASVTDPNGTTTYGYDPDSNNTSITNPNGLIESHTFDALNRILTVSNSTTSMVISSFSNEYDIGGMITKKIFLDGSWVSYRYDALNRLLEEAKQTNTSMVYDYVYSYDAVGNRLTWAKNTSLGGFWSTDSASMPPQTLVNLTSAGFGQMANATQPMSLVRNYNYDAANQLNSWNYAANINGFDFPIETDTYIYDNNGNRIFKQKSRLHQESIPQQTNYSYDFENRLNQINFVIPGIINQTDNYVYSAEGLRAQAQINNVTTNYLYDGFNVLNEQDGSGNSTKAYTRGLDLGGGIGSIINQNYTANGIATTQYYHYNDKGSVSNLISTTGTAVSSYSYDAYGNLLTPQISGDTNRYLFSTKEFDSRSGLYYFGHRYYDPEIGRWLTQDPLGFVDGPNPYLYVNDNPINLVDPLGLWYVNIGVNYALGVQGEGGVIISDKGIYTYTGGGGGTPGAGANITVSLDEPSLGWSSGYQGGFFFGGAYGQTQYSNGSSSNYWEIGLVTPGFSVTSNYVKPYYQWPWISNQTGNTTNQLPAVTNGPDELPDYSNLEAPDLAGKERVE